MTIRQPPDPALRPESRISTVKVGGRGNERFMVIVPAIVGSVIIVYALGGVDQTLIILENMAQSSYDWVRGLF